MEALILIKKATKKKRYTMPGLEYVTTKPKKTGVAIQKCIDCPALVRSNTITRCKPCKYDHTLKVLREKNIQKTI